MTKIFYDTEFLEDGRTIDLISIGMVAEDGRELYAINRDMPHKRIAKHDWLRANVVPSLPRIHGDRRHYVSARRNPLALDFDHPAMMSRERIAAEVEHFIVSTPDVELWAWYGAYDHVALAWLFGPMSNLPSGIPMWTNDLRQEVARLGLSGEDMPEQADGHHNALADARHNRVIAELLASQQSGEASR
ncbi:3'-5' exoribonuclease domain-containing protein [Nonomuraea sp. NPDC003560]|uniref:3'-5' exoribonuclease domain-containing protein n=1 Tax=Nonomuraea sp. NPDC003560 TaxID=3364341 RepID=UPI0036868CCB